LICGIAIIPGSVHALEKVSLQLKWLHQFQFAGYYVALEKGFYRDAGLDVEIR
jgi:ABC-type nitrate/sulfonate/bicarbonate transport system substrate-binding protein